MQSVHDHNGNWKTINEVVGSLFDFTTRSGISGNILLFSLKCKLKKTIKYTVRFTMTSIKKKLSWVMNLKIGDN